MSARDGATELIYLFWAVIMGFLRISTHPAISSAPLTPDEALTNISSLVDLPHNRTPGARPVRMSTSNFLVQARVTKRSHAR